MEPIGHDTDDVSALRSRLAEHERLWESAAARLAAFTRLEELARAQGTTPEVLAGRAALARAEARRAELHGEVEALEATVAGLGAEVERLEQERDRAARHLEQVTADLDRRGADLDAVEREVTALLVARAERSSEVEELTRSRDELFSEVEELTWSRDELCAEVAEFLDGLEDLRSLEDADEPLRPPSPVGVLAGATPPEYEDDGDSAFAQFFETDFEHDKSRDWILSDTEGTGAATAS